MKKIVMITGYLFMAFITVFIAGITTIAIIGNTLDKESKAFVDAAIPAIAAEWDVRELKKRASREFDETVDEDDLLELFDYLRGLGELKEYKGSTGEANITISFLYDYNISADYTASADFEAGSVDMQITLVRHGGQWQILDFTISPEEYTEKKDII
jgi:hypothetical protein